MDCRKVATHIEVHSIHVLGPLLVIMSGTAGRHLQQSAANGPAAAPAEQAPPVNWGDRWDNGASLNYGSRVGEHMHGSHVVQDQCVTSNQLTTPFLACRVCCRGSYWHHPFDLCLDSGL